MAFKFLPFLLVLVLHISFTKARFISYRGTLSITGDDENALALGDKNMAALEPREDYNNKGNGNEGGATAQKNRVRGPQDLALYYAQAPGYCGGMASSMCSIDCGKLGYPVYWCYAQVCYCHFG